jgi:hypothetical protein
MCKGSQLGLCCEGCCFDTLSLSITRIYVVSHIRADDVVSKASRRVELFFVRELLRDSRRKKWLAILLPFGFLRPGAEL